MKQWGIKRKDWEDQRRDALGDRGRWDDQGTLIRMGQDGGNSTEIVRADGSRTSYRRVGWGWRVIEGTDKPATYDANDPHRGTVHENATNWRGRAAAWRDRLTQAKHDGDDEAAAVAQREADMADRIADVKERYPNVDVLGNNKWEFKDGQLSNSSYQHPPGSPDGMRHSADWLRANAEIVELADPLKAAQMRVQADDLEARADDKEADAALNAAADDFERVASGDTFATARAAMMTKPDGDAYLTCTSCDGAGCADCRGWGWTTHPDACELPATGHPCGSCAGKVGCVGPDPAPPEPSKRQPNPPPVLAPPPSAPPPTPPPTTPPPARSGHSGGAPMSGSIGDAAAGIRSSNDTASDATGILAQAIAKLEEARQRLQAAVEGSPQADVGEALGMHGRAIEAIQDAQKAVVAAQSSAESVAARL